MTGHDFDIAVTFAGEDREFVNQVVGLVKAQGLTVFYDEDAKVEMWGEDLTEYFPDVYERRARFAVMFVSAHYAAKEWTRLERRSVLVRAMQSPTPYLLPVRLDSTELPGVRSTISYLEAHVEGASGIADAVLSKLGSSRAVGTRRFNGRVPRTPAEAAILIGERPPGWEYLLFSYWLASGMEQRQNAYNDHRFGFALGGETIESDALMAYANGQLGRMISVTEMFESLLLGPAQVTAMGEPGEPGDPDLIEHLASRMLLIYDDLLAWAYRQRAASSLSEEGRAMLRALADYANQPVESIRAMIFELRNQMDDLPRKLESGERIEVLLEVKFEIPTGVSESYRAARQAFTRRRK